MKLLLAMEIHVTVFGLQATHRPTLAGLLLQSCLIVVSLLGGVWNSVTAHPQMSSKAILETQYLSTINCTTVVPGSNNNNATTVEPVVLIPVTVTRS